MAITFKDVIQDLVTKNNFALFSNLNERYKDLVNTIRENADNEIRLSDISSGSFASRLKALISLARGAKLLDNSSNEVKLGILDRIGLTFMFIGSVHILAGSRVIHFLRNKGCENASTEQFLKEGVIATVLGRVTLMIGERAARLICTKPNLGGFGILVMISAGIAFMDIGFALIRNEELHKAIQSFYLPFKQQAKDFINRVIQQAEKHNELSRATRFFLSMYKGLKFTYAKIRAIVTAISGLLSKNESYTAKDYVLLQEQLGAAISRIVSAIFKIAGVATLLAVGIKVLDELSGGQLLKKLSNENTPYSPLFRKLKEYYDTKVDPVINKLFGKETNAEQQPKENPQSSGEESKEATA